MKNQVLIPPFKLLLLAAAILAACQAVAPLATTPTVARPAIQEPTGEVPAGETPPAGPGLIPSVSPSQAPNASPTPAFTFDPSGFDPDLYPPIDVSHNPPLIAGPDETVTLVFNFANFFCMQLPVSCIPEGRLHYTYGDDQALQNLPLGYEFVDEMEARVARLPATGPGGQSLRYYAEFTVPEAGYTLRYPGAGTIDLFTADHFIPVELAAENAAQPGEKVYDFFWGHGPDQLGKANYADYPQRVGPPAMDVANDGRIALMDPVNQRIILFAPNRGSYSSIPMPFTYKFDGDLAFDPEGRLVVCDWLGESIEGVPVSVPYCYRLLPDGQLDDSTPVYAKSKSKITRDLKVLDTSDYRFVIPFNWRGQPNSRESQRQKETWDFPARYVEGMDPYVARFADVKKGLAFKVRSVSPLGGILEFAQTPQGYILIFSLGDRIRAVWINSAGVVQKDVILPNGQYSEINLNGQVAVAQDGSLYTLSSTERGIEIHYTGAPSVETSLK